MEHIIQQITPIFNRVFQTNLEIHSSTSADEVATWDSLSHVVFIGEIETAFSVVFDLDELLSFNNIGDIAKAIEQKNGI